MSESTEAAKTAEQPANGHEGGKKSSSKLIIIILAVVVLLGGGGGVFFYLQKVKANDEKGKAEETGKEKKSEKGKKHEEEEEEGGEEEEASAENSGENAEKGKKTKSVALLLPKDKDVKHVLDIQPFILNLADPSENRYLRLSVSVGIAGEEVEEKPNPLVLTRLRNALLAVLMTKTSEEVLTIEGKIALRKELLKTAKKVVEEPEIEAIYITELIVQK